MGGSASTAGKNPGPGGKAGSDPCDLKFETDLFSPVENVAARLSVGDQLSVELYVQQQTTSVAVLAGDAKEVAGTIAGVSRIGDLVLCLQRGEEYEAEVISIVGPQIAIRVERVRS